MKRLLRDGILFLLAFLILFHFIDRWTFDPSDTSSTWKWIQEEHDEPIDILIMGNSHAFCDINPTIINQSMDLNTMILGSNSQPMDQTYENLRILLHYVHPKVILLEANTLAITTDTLYGGGNEGRLYSNFDSIENPFYRLSAIIHTIKNYQKWPEAFSQLLRPTNTWTRFDDHTVDPDDTESRVNFLLGYHPRHNIIKYSVIEPAEVEQKLIEQRDKGNTLKNPGSIDALHKFLDLAEKEDIPVYIVKTPILYYKNELPQIANIVEELLKTETAIKGYRNFSEQMTLIGIEHNDFSDEGHLNRDGANKFTLSLTEWLSEELGIPYDLTKVTGVMGESYEELPDGKYRYTVNLMDNTLIKFITKDENDAVTFETEYTDVNYIDIPRVSSKNKLFYRICSKQGVSGREYPFEQMEYPFMHDEGILSGFTVDNFTVTQTDNVFKIVNTYEENKVKYSWYVKKGKNVIEKTQYSEDSASFEYTFKDPGEYTVLCYVKLVSDPSESKSEQAITVTVTKGGKVTYTIP